MTHVLGLNTVRKQEEEVTRLFRKIEQRAETDLAVQAGYDEKSAKELQELVDAEQALNSKFGYMEKQLKRCTNMEQMMTDTLSRPNLSSLSSDIDNLHERVGMQAFSIILSNPGFSRGLLRFWGPEWEKILHDALDRDNGTDERLDAEEEIGSQRVEFDKLRQQLGDEREKRSEIEIELVAKLSLLDRQAQQIKGLESELEVCQARLKAAKVTEDRLNSTIEECRRDRGRVMEQAKRFMNRMLPLLGSVADIKGLCEEDSTSLIAEFGTGTLMQTVTDGTDCWTWPGSGDGHAGNVHVACLQLYFSLGTFQLLPSLLQRVALQLATATELHHGLCRALAVKIADLVNLIATDDELSIDQLLPLCNIVDTIHKRCPTAVDGTTSRRVLRRAVNSLVGAENEPLKAVVCGWKGAMWEAVPLCGPVVVEGSDQPPAVALVESLGRFLFVDQTTKQLLWLSMDCIDWETSGITELRFDHKDSG
ncbi:hypothetical protein K4F52_002449 [Lecanicillium sp. MT-2017a]|nr:hypothetical protein K4F52_002449 [Lecanicillium sp. MT-2017a]